MVLLDSNFTSLKDNASHSARLSLSVESMQKHPERRCNYDYQCN